MYAWALTVMIVNRSVFEGAERRSPMAQTHSGMKVKSEANKRASSQIIGFTRRCFQLTSPTPTHRSITKKMLRMMKDTAPLSWLYNHASLTSRVSLAIT